VAQKLHVKSFHRLLGGGWFRSAQVENMFGGALNQNDEAVARFTRSNR